MQAGSPDGAANRAYYAMFNAARAALSARSELKLEDIRRHSAVLKLFSLHVVKPGLLPAKLRADINEVFQARAIADYATASVSTQDARELLDLMDEMLEAVGALLGPEGARP
ncbi:MAG TPA: HEPN domain-containing protein [Afifellaceae bacterium]|nr:HEPN domain-containing protein [Afifellaceae bacterium]